MQTSEMLAHYMMFSDALRQQVNFQQQCLAQPTCANFFHPIHPRTSSIHAIRVPSFAREIPHEPSSIQLPIEYRDVYSKKIYVYIDILEGCLMIFVDPKTKKSEIALLEKRVARLLTEHPESLQVFLSRQHPFEGFLKDQGFVLMEEQKDGTIYRRERVSE